MQLNQYPKAIAAQQTKILNMRRDLRLLEAAQKSLLLAIKGKVANDANLKNDTQRKAREAELIEADTDLELNSRELLELKDDISLEEINLELICNEFSVLKIEARERTASLLAVAA